MSIRHFLLVACFTCLLPFRVFSEAPVVDDSENFALLDEQQAALERPVARDSHQRYENDNEPAFANDTGDASNNDGGRHNGDLLNKLQGLQQDIQELRGQLEVQAHELKALQEQQLSFYKDLDARLRNDVPLKTTKNEPTTELPLNEQPVIKKPTLSLDKPTAPAVINTKTTTTNNPADEQISYLAAYELIKNKQFDDALIAMQTFVTQHPQGGYTANAHYWLGELYMVKKNYPNAIQHFETVLQQFPSSSKSAACLLKSGYALAASGKKQEAIQRLQQVLKSYPDTNTAQLAETKLKALTI